VTANSAKIMGLDGYGIAPGNKAHMVLLQAANPIEAIRLRATRLAVIRSGKIIAQADPHLTKLSLPGRPAQVNPADYAPAAKQGW
jgi:cytosine/creatinine deaminase